MFKQNKSDGIMNITEKWECMAYMDPVEAIMRSEKPRRLAAEGKIEDAIACAMAEGYRMGWEAYRKKIGNS